MSQGSPPTDEDSFADLVASGGLVEAQPESWKQERPQWCPFGPTCIYRASSQAGFCVGEMTEPKPHGGDLNTHRMCFKQSDDPMMPPDYFEINRGDAWHFVRILTKVFGLK